MRELTRRRVLGHMAPAAALAALLPRQARAAAEFPLKFANNLPLSHPVNVRAAEAAARIASESGGRVEISIFPDNQLGGDTDMLTQVRSGGIDIFTAGTLVVATMSPVSAITAVGFAFSQYDQVWNALDGRLGERIRADFARIGFYTFQKIWDNGFRQITTSSKPISMPDDLIGLKIRVPVSPMGISMFKSLGASPMGLQFSEVYSALETKIVDAQENPLAIVQAAKLYEVQKFCSRTNHSWDGFHVLFNGRSWEALPDDLKLIIERAFNEAGMLQREDVRTLNDTLESDLAAKGMLINETEPDSFRAQLQKSGFYTKWKAKFGDETWALLEESAGKPL